MCKGCCDLGKALAGVAVRCDGANQKTAFQQFEQQAAGGSCKHAQGLRDEVALRNVCLPWIGTATCEEVRAGLPDACVNQVVHLP